MRAIDVVHFFAGFMILLSVALSHFHSKYWLFLTIFVGLNLFQFGITKICPLEFILNKLWFDKRRS